MLDRRALITGGAALGALAGLALPGVAGAGPIPANGLLQFAIFRNGKPFGNYKVSFVTSGDLLTVTTDVAMNMRVAKLTVFDYRHHCQEMWRKGVFSELHSHTVRDNDQQGAETVDATRSDFDIRVVTKKGAMSAPPKANPLTHWNAATLGGPLFNPQDGLMLDLTSRDFGRDGVVMGNGTQMLARHVALRGSQQLDEWYDDAGLWAGLKGVFPDKSVIEYRRL